MALTEKFARKHLARLKPITENMSLERSRNAQDIVGRILMKSRLKSCTESKVQLKNCQASVINPKDTLRNGIILYLHGGGYACGDIEYASGFGSVLATECGMPTFCLAYRLAPENKFPAALNDALDAYEYLTGHGYSPKHILICGESAGGGLAYSLCLKLKEKGLSQPAGIIAISPWTDLTLSGNSYKVNVDKDPTMTVERLKAFSQMYIDDPKDPYASPLFADLSELAPSLIFAGGSEIMLDDSVRLHDRLLEFGSESEITIKEDMWHAYPLYCLKEHTDDFESINQFIDTRVQKRRKLKWMRLDNAAKIYPAARNRNWTNLFRLSVDFDEPIDIDILKSALDVTIRRFPSIAVRLKHGMFWYYLEEIPHAPEFSVEHSYPLVKMSKNEIGKCAFRVIPYKNRLAVELFHSLTDGNGGLIFIKTLAAEYLEQKYKICIPHENGVLDRLKEPYRYELEDSFLKNGGKVSASRKESTPYHISGEKEPDGFLNLTCLTVNANELREKAKEYGVKVTSLLCAAMTKAILNIQARHVPNRRKQKPVKVLIPINLRDMFNSKTLRNFVLYASPEIDPRMGDYDFGELCYSISHQLAFLSTKKQLQAKFTTNVNSEKLFIVRIMPLFIKNIVMKIIFMLYGENKSCLSLSNLGLQILPAEMGKHITGMDFILGPQARMPYNCGVISYKDTVRINFIRNTIEPELEHEFFKQLQSIGIHCTVESNQK